MKRRSAALGLLAAMGSFATYAPPMVVQVRGGYPFPRKPSGVRAAKRAAAKHRRSR